MTSPRRLLPALLAAGALFGLNAAPSSAIVGGTDAAPGEFPAVAEVILGGAFGCTGTLISPDTVLTAGHCSSLTGGAGVATPLAFPPQLISVRIGSTKPGTGGETPTVSRVVMQPNYLLGDGYDISLLKLTKNASATPAKVSGASETAAWSVGTSEQIVGFGTTSSGGDAAATLQKASVPVVSDADCGKAYSQFDAKTMICAGYPEGGTDTCQGDSGGPLFGRTAAGALRVVGATSFGNGCAEAGYPGVYARVGDAILRTWIASQDADGVA